MLNAKKMKINTIFQPSKIHLESINEYLCTEQITGNLSSVLSSFEKGELIVMFRGKELVGFSAYQFDYPVSKIEVVEIVKKYRKKGLGKKLADTTLKEIRKKEGEVVELFCAPSDSESFWKIVGFKNLPETRFTNGRIIMYKILIETLLPSETDNDEIVELCNVEPNQASRFEPKWSWRINSNEFNKPIIQPTDYDWQICWKKGETEIKKDKVKYFSSIQINFGNYLILRNMKNIKH